MKKQWIFIFLIAVSGLIVFHIYELKKGRTLESPPVLVENESDRIKLQDLIKERVAGNKDNWYFTVDEVKVKINKFGVLIDLELKLGCDPEPNFRPLRPLASSIFRDLRSQFDLKGVPITIWWGGALGDGTRLFGSIKEPSPLAELEVKTGMGE